MLTVVRAVVQRATEASVVVDGAIVGAIGPGLCVLLGVTHDDSEAVADKMADKLLGMRIFSDTEGKMNRSVLDIDGGLLVVSQFTLYGDGRKGNRPSFMAAAAPEVAEALIERVVARLRTRCDHVATGRFRADMAVHLVNDGPVTIILEL